MPREAMTRGPNPVAGTAPSHWRDRPATWRTGAAAPEEVEMRRAIVVLCSVALLLTGARAAVAGRAHEPAPRRSAASSTWPFGPCPMRASHPGPRPVAVLVRARPGGPRRSGRLLGGSAGGSGLGRMLPPGTSSRRSRSGRSAGGWFAGTETGQWNMGTGAFRASGPVTAASPEWAGMVGYRFHESGDRDLRRPGLHGLRDAVLPREGKRQPLAVA